MSRIIRNSVLNGAAMGITSVLSLVLIPVLIGQYGLAEYGLMPLLRLLTPLGALGIVALGLPQLATRAVATLSARGELEALKRVQSTLVTVAALIGAAAAAVLLGIGAERFAVWFKVEPAQQAAFAVGFDAAALLLPLLVPGTVLTAALSGLGRFRVLRLTEVTIYLAYFAAGIGAVLASLPIQVVIIAFLAADAMRAAALLWHAGRHSLIGLRPLLQPDLPWLGTVRREFVVLSVAGLLGYLRKHLASGAIALAFGPSAIGLYDAIERVPRALKSLLGLVNTSVLPHALRLDATADSARLRTLLIRGTRLTVLCTVPLAVAVMLYSAAIISGWLGAGLSYGAAFLVLLMIPFLLDSTLSIITTATLSRLDLISRQNRIALVEIGVFLGLLFALIGAAGQAAPYAATAAAAAAGYLLRLKAFLPAYHIGGGLWTTILAKALGGGLAGAGCIALAVRAADASLLVALCSIPLAVVASAAAILLLWTSDERKDVHTVFASLRGLLAPR